MGEQQRLEKENFQGVKILGSETSYPPINSNVLPSHFHASGLDLSTTNRAIDPAAMKQFTSSLDIPGPRDVVVKEYSEWQQSNITDDTVKSAFRQACDVTLVKVLHIEQVHDDQDPGYSLVGY